MGFYTIKIKTDDDSVDTKAISAVISDIYNAAAHRESFTLLSALLNSLISQYEKKHITFSLFTEQADSSNKKFEIVNFRFKHSTGSYGRTASEYDLRVCIDAEPWEFYFSLPGAHRLDMNSIVGHISITQDGVEYHKLWDESFLKALKSDAICLSVIKDGQEVYLKDARVEGQEALKLSPASESFTARILTAVIAGSVSKNIVEVTESIFGRF